MIRRGDFGEIIGAAVHRWALEISGGGCQQISVMRLLAGAEVEQVVTWGTPQEALDGDTDEGLAINGIFRLSSGIECPVFGTETPNRGVDVWSAGSLVRWDWGPPELYKGFDGDGRRVRIEHEYAPYEWSEFRYLTTSIRSFISAVETGKRACDIRPRPATGAGSGDRRQVLGQVGQCAGLVAAGGQVARAVSARIPLGRRRRVGPPAACAGSQDRGNRVLRRGDHPHPSPLPSRERGSLTLTPALSRQRERG